MKRAGSAYSIRFGSTFVFGSVVDPVLVIGASGSVTRPSGKPAWVTRIWDSLLKVDWPRATSEGPPEKLGLYEAMTASARPRSRPVAVTARKRHRTAAWRA